VRDEQRDAEESGTATRRARKAAQIVPNRSGATYSQKFDDRSDAVSLVAPNAGSDWTMRKIATAAR
jgi:hypothetical protein